MAKKSLIVEDCKSWDCDRWNDFYNPTFQKLFSNLSQSDQQEILMQRELFWNCYNGNSNPISEGENKNPEDGYEEQLEETRKKSPFAVRIVHLLYETSFAASTKAPLIADLDAPVSIRALALSGILLFCG